ncbi:glycosyltransferase [Acinetobacter indicus]|uniref:glycosyltransferase n=1 Tax=Acinetobacter TaxID=469 RepID=UPI000CEBB1B0|nr:MULTISPECIES: glycosyltransferase [Acinetobacter]QFS18185.1 glycosyltransferase [Acinetobacter indicus]UNW03820.1 glycosyltransferase [Acinetobacter indicus]
MKKKVVLAIFTLQGNGAERFALTLAKGINDAGHEAHLVYFKDIIDLPIPDGVKTHFFNYQKFRAIPKFMRAGFAAKAFDRFVRKHIGEPDLVLSNLYPVDFILSRSQLPNVHMVIHNTTSLEYGERLTPEFKEQLARVYLAKPCVAVSQGVEQDFRQIFGEQSQITTIYNPIDVEAVQLAAKAFKPDVPERYLVNVGKFKQQKRHDVLIRAYAKAPIDLPLLLVGTGELMAENERLAQELGVADRVHFVGFQKNPYPYIEQATAMVVSSDFEGFSIAILEALALGTPVISTDCPSGPREVLSETCLVPVQDVEALAEKLRLLAQGEFQPKAHIEEQFRIKAAVAAYLNLSVEKK